MATELALAEIRNALPTPSLPPRLGVLALAVGTVKHPGQEVRYHLPTGTTLSEEDRAAAKSLLSTYTSMLDPGSTFIGKPAAEARDELIAKLLAGLSVGQTSDAAADARLDLYEMACCESPAWAVGLAIVAWVRRRCPPDVDKNPNFAFPPSPSILGELARREMEAYRISKERLERLLAAVPIAQALSLDPIEQDARNARPRTLRRMP